MPVRAVRRAAGHDQTKGITARELIATVDEDELTRILYQYGEETRARKIARVIVRERPRVQWIDQRVRLG